MAPIYRQCPLAPLPTALGHRRAQPKLLHRPRQQRSGVGLRVFRDRVRKADGCELAHTRRGAAHSGQYRQAAGVAEAAAGLSDLPPHLGDGGRDRAQPQSPRGQLSGGASARYFSTEAFSGRDRHPHHRRLARGDGTRLFCLAIELTKYHDGLCNEAQGREFQRSPARFRRHRQVPELRQGSRN